MNRSMRALGFLGMAVVSGSAALVGLYHLIRGYQDRIAEMRRPEDTVMVIVAARDLYQGLPIEEEDLYAVQIPPKFLPEGVFLSPEHVVGRIPRERVLANDLVRAERLADPENGVGLETIIPRGLRAISVDISDGRALSGFLEPGSYVDVLVTIQPEDDGKPPITRTLLQAVFVLGVDSRMGSESKQEASDRRTRNRPSVTLLVTSDQAEQVAHGDVLGDLTLSLRSSNDVTTRDATAPIDVAALLGHIQPDIKPIRRKKEEKVACIPVETIHGDHEVVSWVLANGEPCPVPPGGGSR